jgi:hypothetical protein
MLFNYAVSNAEVIELNEMAIEPAIEAVLTYFKALEQNFPGYAKYNI